MSGPFFDINIQQPRLFVIMIHPLPRFNVSKAAANHPYFDGCTSLSHPFMDIYGTIGDDLLLLYYCFTGPINHQQHPTTTFIRDYEPSITIWQVAIVWVGWFNPLVFSGTFFFGKPCVLTLKRVVSLSH